MKALTPSPTAALPIDNPAPTAAHSHPPPTHLVAQVVHLLRKACARIHDESPQVLAAGHRGDVQAVVIALLHVLLHTVVGHVVVVALLHGPVRVVHRDPLGGGQPQPDALLRGGQLQVYGLALLSPALLPHLHRQRAAGRGCLSAGDVQGRTLTQ